MLERAKVGDEMKALDQEGRAALRQLGIRFGAFHLYRAGAAEAGAPRARRPALGAQAWRAGDDRASTTSSISRRRAAPPFPVDKAVPKGLYRAAGYRVCGERAVRVDILERLADLIRPAIAYRPGRDPGQPPTGAADQDGFVVTGAMTSLVGCAGEDFASILRSLGYVSVKRPGPAITVPLGAAAGSDRAGSDAVVAEGAMTPTAADEAVAGRARTAQAASRNGGHRNELRLPVRPTRQPSPPWR